MECPKCGKVRQTFNACGCGFCECGYRFYCMSPDLPNISIKIDNNFYISLEALKDLRHWDCEPEYYI